MRKIPLLFLFFGKNITLKDKRTVNNSSLIVESTLDETIKSLIKTFKIKIIN